MKKLNIRFLSVQRNIELANKLPIILNSFLIALGVFIICAMSVVIAIFEEFTAFTDYTQDWIEFNLFIHYWDRITISRVYLSFLFIYGGTILASKQFIYSYHNAFCLFKAFIWL